MLKTIWFGLWSLGTSNPVLYVPGTVGVEDEASGEALCHNVGFQFGGSMAETKDASVEQVGHGSRNYAYGSSVCVRHSSHVRMCFGLLLVVLNYSP